MAKRTIAMALGLSGHPLFGEEKFTKHADLKGEIIWSPQSFFLRMTGARKKERRQAGETRKGKSIGNVETATKQPSVNANKESL